VFRTIRERLRRGVVTERDLFGSAAVPPPLFRGMPELDPARCRGHAACAAVCPSGAIAVPDRGAEGWSWRLDRARCVGCGACVEACPTGALASGPEFLLAARRREDLVDEVIFEPDAAPVEPAAGGEAPEDAALGERLRRRTASLFRASCHVRHLDVGSSNAEDWELAALLGPVYDLQRLGIDVVASPRHADMLVVTGPVTRNLLPALQETYRATPEPRIVLALGTDACSGGVFGASYATAGGADRHVPVDVYVPGDPPRPQAIVHGLLLALDRRAQSARPRRRSTAPRGPRARR
jgi:Ni,Fe-hydrogenase III small subunit/formate hydrogenlyase subunit 6/NADH:ubiquinone oxidoreductase subunit I